MNAKRTPGPWRADSDLWIVGANGVAVCRLPEPMGQGSWQQGQANRRVILAGERALGLLESAPHTRQDPEEPSLHEDDIEGCFGCEARALLAGLEEDGDGR